MKVVTRRFKYKLNPTNGQKKILNRITDEVTLTWNIALTHLIKQFGTRPNICNRKFLNKTAIANLNTSLRKENPLIRKSLSTATQQKLMDLGIAYQGYFKNRLVDDSEKYFPKFKSYNKPQSFELTDNAFWLINGRLKIQKYDNLFKIRWSRALPSKPTSLTIMRDSIGDFFVSFVCTVKVNRGSGEGDIGIDVGTKYYGTISNGEVIENPEHLQKVLPKIRTLNQKLSRTKKGSRMFKRFKLKLARIYRAIRFKREDFQHRLSNKLIKQFQVIVIEGLSIKQLLKTNKRAFNKTGNRKIADVSWGSFFNKLKYKIGETKYGKVFLADKHFPSTQLCSNCDKYPTVKLTKEQRVHNCEYCNQSLERDLNASLNLEKLGTKVISNSSLWKPVPGLSNVFATPKYDELKSYLGYP